MKALETFIPSEGTPPPFEEVPYFIASRKGWMTNMPTLFGIAQTGLKGEHPNLPETPHRFELNDRKLPEILIKQAHSFFRAVFNKQKTESSLYITYHRTKNEFRLWCPEQYVSFASVNHKLEPLKGGWTVAGTIHSHCNFSAFHSGTDKHDMEGVPGLHITIGHVDRDNPEYAIALSLGDHKFDVDYADIIDPLPPGHSLNEQHPSHWMGFVKSGTAPWTGVVTKYSSYKPSPTTAYHKGSGWQGKPARDIPKMEPIVRSPHQSYGTGWQSKGPSEDWDYLYAPRQLALDLESKAIDEYTTDEQAFGYYADVIEDFQWDLQMLESQLDDYGFKLNWTITWDPILEALKEDYSATTP